MLSRAHVAIRSMYEEEVFGLRALSQALGVHPQTLRYILTGTTPKVTLAIAIQRELGIDVNDWAIPARVSDHP